MSRSEGHHITRSQGHHITRSQGHCITVQISYCSKSRLAPVFSILVPDPYSLVDEAKHASEVYSFFCVLTSYLVCSLAYMSKRRTLVLVLLAPMCTPFFCWLLLHMCILIESRPKCVHQSKENRLCDTIMYILPQNKCNFNFQNIYGDPGRGSMTPGHV